MDLDALMSVRHRCRPAACKDALCCCSSYDVEVSRREREMILSILPETTRFSPILNLDPDPPPLFKDIGKSAYLLGVDSREFCLLAYFGSQREPLCSLHSAAGALGLAPARYKPRCCSLWPLAIEPYEIPVLSLHPDALLYPCNQARDPSRTALDAGVADIIRSIWGRDFLEKVNKAVTRRIPKN